MTRIEKLMIALASIVASCMCSIITASAVVTSIAHAEPPLIPQSASPKTTSPPQRPSAENIPPAKTSSNCAEVCANLGRAIGFDGTTLRLHARNVIIDADASAKLQGVMTELKGSGQMTVQGAVVRIN